MALSTKDIESKLEKYEKAHYDNRFNLFQPIPTELAIESETKTKFYPLIKPENGQVLQFVIPPTSFQYTDFSRCTLQFKAKIQKGSSAVVKTDLVGFVNSPHLAFFRQVDLYLNQTLVTDGINVHYSHHGYLETLLTKTAAHMSSVGEIEMFEKDTAGKFDDLEFQETGTDGVNMGQYFRFQRTQAGKDVQFEVPLYLDVCKMQQFMISGVEIRLDFHWADPSLALVKNSKAVGEFSYKTSDHVLNWQFVEPTPALLYKHVQLINEEPAVYNYERTTMKSYTVPAGLSEWWLDSVFTQLPHTMYVCMVESKAFQGDMSQTPWKFQHNKLTNLSFHVENQQHILLTPDFEKEEYTEEYLGMVAKNSSDPLISYLEYSGGYTIFCLDLSPGVRRSYNTLSSPASTRLHLRFKTDLLKNTTVIIRSLYMGQFKIDRAKNVYLVN